VLTDRNLIVALPALLLLSARAIASLERRFEPGRWVAGVLLVALLFDLVIRRDYYTRATKWQYRQTAETILEQTAGQPERPFVVSGAWHPSYFDYYFGHGQGDVRVDASAIGEPAIQGICDRAHPRDLWVTAPAPGLAAPPHPLRLDGYQRKASWRFLGWTLDHFVAVARVPSAAPPSP
jgi:hypothetical protein